MKQYFKSLIFLAATLFFCLSTLHARVIENGAVWEQVLLATDLPKDPPLTGTVWPNPTANFGLMGEGICTDRDGVVYMCDITTSANIPVNNPGGIIWRYDPMTKKVTRFLQPSGRAGGTHFDKNDLIVCDGPDSTYGLREVRRFNVKTGASIVIANDYPAGSSTQLVGPNDVTVDHKGRIFFTDSAFNGTNSGPVAWTLPFAVYRIDTDGSLHQIITNLARPNGIEISPDGSKLYVCNCGGPNAAPTGLPPNSFSPLAAQGYDVWGYTLSTLPFAGNAGGNVVVYDLNSKGEIVDLQGNVSPENGNTTAGRSIISRSNVIPDGSAMDLEGNMYVAWHNGGFNTIAGNPPISNWLGEITVTNQFGNQIDDLTPELLTVPPIAGIPTPALTTENQIMNFRTVQVGFGKGPTKHILYLMRGQPWGLYSIKTKQIGFS